MKSYKYLLLFVFNVTYISVSVAQAQQLPAIPLWPNGAPGANPNGGEETVRIHETTGDHVVSNVHNPSVIPYLPSKENATGIAVVIAPGGAHREIWIDHEGHNVARLLSEKGIAAFIVKYRLARSEGSTYSVEDHSVKDMLRAVRLVRSRASEWNIDPDKIGVMGFSAGGQVAAMADIYADSGRVDVDEKVETFSSKPNFQVLIYPAWVNDIRLSKDSSPAFILGGFQDMESISTGMAKLYLKFKEQNIPAELHIYADASHGFGIRKENSGPSSKWTDALIAWIYDFK